ARETGFVDHRIRHRFSGTVSVARHSPRKRSEQYESQRRGPASVRYVAVERRTRLTHPLAYKCPSPVRKIRFGPLFADVVRSCGGTMSHACWVPIGRSVPNLHSNALGPTRSPSARSEEGGPNAACRRGRPQTARPL